MEGKKLGYGLTIKDHYVHAFHIFELKYSVENKIKRYKTNKHSVSCMSKIKEIPVLSEKHSQMY